MKSRQTFFLSGLILNCIALIMCSKSHKSSQSRKHSSNSKDLGQRIVGAEEVDPTTRAPFLAVFNFRPVKHAQCTGSIIAEHWAVSAAHCLGHKSKLSVDDCGSGLVPPLKGECTQMKNGDLKITPEQDDDEAPRVYVGIKNFLRSPKDAQFLRVEYIIRNKYSYPGGTYGTYGGYDIILIKLVDPVSSLGPDVIPIALPKDESFPDTGPANIAGYGRYRRAPCQVGRSGPAKFDYCGVEKGCTRDSKKFQSANCSTVFSYEGKTIKGCSYEATPSATNPVCQRFLKKENFQFRKNVDEIVILKKSKGKFQVQTKCYRTSAGSYGWCGTMRDYQNFPDFDIKVESDAGWGFCEKSCYPDMDVSLGGIARAKRVDITNDEYCDSTLTGKNFDSATSKEYEVKPIVLCVALNFTYRSLFYENEEGTFKKLENLSDEEANQLLDRDSDYYITGSGTCGGDSGGPLYKIMKNSGNGNKEFVLIGTTSRGTGVRGNCGGLNNPTHYVRVKFFVKWIKEVVGAENLKFASM